MDLCSSKGCLVKGRRVRELRVRDGDLIDVGHHQLRFAGPAMPGEKPHDESKEPAERTLTTPKQQLA
jgi:hypothetical protein